jgi:hypothetical protein
MMILREIVRVHGQDVQRDVCVVSDRIDAVVKATAAVRSRIPVGRAHGLFVVMEEIDPVSYHERQVGNPIRIAVS